MKKGLKSCLSVVLAVVGLFIAGVAVMFFANLCPPQGPWPMPPWCEGSGFSLPFMAPSTGSGNGVPAAFESLPEDGQVSTSANEILSRVGNVQGYYHEAVQAIGETAPLTGSISPQSIQPEGGVYEVRMQSPVQKQYGIPDAFRLDLDISGYMKAPAGACGAGAAPKASFYVEQAVSLLPAGVQPVSWRSQNTERVFVTPALFEEIGAKTITYEFLVGEGETDITTFMNALILPNTMKLTTVQGWNEVLWEPLRARQEPVKSLMDYYIWSASPQIEAQIVKAVEDRLTSMGVPPVVVQAFQGSTHNGWFASPVPTPDYQLAGMHVIAEFSGDLSGTIEEDRDFSIPVPGEMPVFGPMTGAGQIAYAHPTLGQFNFDVTLEWTHWDEMGRVDGGTLHMVDAERGVEIVLTISPDGTRKGDVFRDGEKVGEVNMDVVGSSTYLDMQTGDDYPMP
jgi:hypothetical protein